MASCRILNHCHLSSFPRGTGATPVSAHSHRNTRAEGVGIVENENVISSTTHRKTRGKQCEGRPMNGKGHIPFYSRTSAQLGDYFLFPSPFSPPRPFHQPSSCGLFRWHVTCTVRSPTPNSHLLRPVKVALNSREDVLSISRPQRQTRNRCSHFILPHFSLPGVPGRQEMSGCAHRPKVQQESKIILSIVILIYHLA